MKTQGEDRTERLAQALRENLKRRKARGRAASGKSQRPSDQPDAAGQRKTGPKEAGKTS